MPFARQKKALVLLIDDSGTELLVWQNRKLTQTGHYRGTPEDLEHFAVKLQDYRHFPAILLTDLIEESFRHDTVVHVGGSDRTALLARKLDFAFRTTPYRLGKVTGRDKLGRRDDHLLLSAITKPDLLDPWVSVLLKEKFAIQGITSVAHLLHDFVALEKQGHEPHLLVINLDERNNLRQTYFSQGRILFSRLTTLSSRDAEELGGDILHETQQIRQYLERIQFLPYEATLRIRVYLPNAQAVGKLLARTASNNPVDCFDVTARLGSIVRCAECEPPGPVHHFLATVLERQRPDNVYAPQFARRYHNLEGTARLLNISTSLLLLISLVTAAFMYRNIRDQQEQRDLLLAQTTPLQNEYQLLSQRFPVTPIPPREMELVVKTYENILGQIHSPLEALNNISSALARSPGLRLTGITWRLVEKPAEPSVAGYSVPPQATERPAAGTELIGPVLQGRTQLKITIDGQAYSPNSYRDAQNQVNAFVLALGALPQSSVQAVRMPTDVRTDITVSTLVNDNEVRAPFTLELTMAAGTP